ncbi:MAG: carbohydrate kinase family protein [Patescibacteria group bacterium]|jgi:adenosine kinase
MIKKVLVTGSIAYDRIMDFPGHFKDQILPEKIHILNVSFLVKELKESFGGTAGNIAYNLALVGLRPTILTNVGAKDFALYQAWLKKNNIDLSQTKILPGQHTASAYIITDQADNQIAGFYPGAMSTPLTKRLKPKTYNLKADIAIISPQNPIDMVNFPKLFKQRKIPYIFDPGQQTTSLSGNQLKKAILGSQVLIGNDYEINLISKKTGWINGVLVKKTGILVTTLGEKGSIIKQGDKVYKIPPARPRNTSDPTGAGDAYRAGLIYGWLKNWPLGKVGRFAGLISVYTVEKYGTQTHRFTWPDLKKRYRQNFGEQL